MSGQKKIILNCAVSRASHFWGAGISILEILNIRNHLSLSDTKTYSSGLVQLFYKVKETFLKNFSKQ